jgi:hypothetical protein
VAEHRVRDAIQADRASLTGLQAVWEVPGADLLRAVTWCWAVWPGRRLSFIGRWLGDAAKG